MEDTKTVDTSTHVWTHGSIDIDDVDISYPHDIEIVDPPVEQELDFETEMYQLADDHVSDSPTATILRYEPDQFARTVEITLEMPNDSIGTIEYDIPESSSDEFVEFVHSAVFERDGQLRPIFLTNVEDLEGATVPVRCIEGDNWQVNTDIEVDWDADVDVSQLSQPPLYMYVLGFFATIPWMVPMIGTTGSRFSEAMYEVLSGEVSTREVVSVGSLGWGLQLLFLALLTLYLPVGISLFLGQIGMIAVSASLTV